MLFDDDHKSQPVEIQVFDTDDGKFCVKIHDKWNNTVELSVFPDWDATLEYLEAVGVDTSSGTFQEVDDYE